MADTLKTAYPFKTRTETADAGEHVKKSNSHRASELYLLFFRFTSHRHDGATFVLVQIFIVFLFFLSLLFFGEFFFSQFSEGVFT